MKRKKFIILGISLLLLSVWVDRASANEPTQPELTQTRSAESILELSQDLELRFDYYYEQLSQITNGLDAQIRSSELDEERQIVLLDQVQAIRENLEAAKLESQEVIVDLELASTQIPAEALVTVSKTKQKAVSVRQRFKNTVYMLRGTLENARTSIN